MYKKGDLVRINPNWDKSQGDYGICGWREYLGKTYKVSGVFEHFVVLEKDPFGFYFPIHMLMKATGILTYEIERWQSINET